MKTQTSWLRPFGILALLCQVSSAQTTSPDRRDQIFYPGDSERVKPLATKLAKNVWMDQRAIWTSPFHADRRNAARWAAFGAVTTALIVTDRRTSKFLENSPTQVRWGNNISKVGAAYTLLPAAAAFYIAGVAADSQKARETGILGGEALLDALIVSQAIKVSAGRNRPNAPDHPGNFFSGGASFTSGHATEAWALASVIAHEYRNRRYVPFLAYGLASTVSAARFGARQHYASDLFAGAAMGYFIGRYVVNTHEAHAGHLHVSFLPLVEPGTRTYGLSLRLTAGSPKGSQPAAEETSKPPGKFLSYH